MAVARVLSALLALYAVACAPPRIERKESSDSQIITEAQVEASGAPNAYEVIQRVHANFLHDRGETSLAKSRSAPYPVVYVDGQEFGSIPSLRNIPAIQIA